MPFFNRKTQPADANTATATGSTNTPTTEKPGLKGLLSRRGRQASRERALYGHEQLNARPKFGQWLKGTIFDILTMIIMGAIGLGVSAIFSLMNTNADTNTTIRSTSPHQHPPAPFPSPS